MTGWTVRGTTDNMTTCEICGKIELRGTVHLITAEGDEIFAGTTCAARKVGTTTGVMRGAVKAAKLRAEILEGHFAEYFRKIHGRTPQEHLSQPECGPGSAAEHYVNRCRERWMRRGGHVK